MDGSPGGCQCEGIFNLIVKRKRKIVGILIYELNEYIIHLYFNIWSINLYMDHRKCGGSGSMEDSYIGADLKVGWYLY